ncbi:hypothetical protein J2Z19_005307 [Ensifer adhaerens]|uniref:Uncharacterized protein n=1 Tax=Ensifer adhaerens TaxID=106592 RepID=A0ACC5T369_ENSAD|nr:hypothetical protein [Ensifer adhaerens]MBP1875571.1 hypothetical protein [Ensifer adhaerens]
MLSFLLGVRSVAVNVRLDSPLRVAACYRTLIFISGVAEEGYFAFSGVEG